MLFKGTARRGVGQIAREIETAGGDINAWTSFDQTVYHVVMSSRELDRGLDIMADAIQQSAFDPDELARELEVILEEIKRGNDTPSRVASRMLFETAYRAHPYRKPVIGTRESVQSFTREAILRFYHRWYTAGNMVLVIGGDFDEQEALAKVQAAFAGLRTGRVERSRSPEPEQTAERGRAFAGRFRETHLTLAFHTPEIRHDDIPALDLLALVLGQGESSRLSLEVKRELELVNEVGAYNYKMREPGLLLVNAQLAARNLAAAYQEILRRVFALRVRPVDEEEMDKARTLIESSTVYEKETIQGLTTKLGYYEVVAGDLAWEKRYYEGVRRCTADDLVRVARRTLHPDRLNVTVLLEEEAPAPVEVDSLLQTARALFDEIEGTHRHGGAIGKSGVVRHRVPNGPLVLVDRDASVPLVAMRAVFAGGLRFETVADNGVGMLMSQCITRGTSRRTAADIAREVDRTAGSLGGFMRMNSIGLRADFLTRNFAKGLDLLADCLLDASYSEAEVAKERALQLEEIRAQEDHLASATFREFSRVLYGQHPYGLPMLGTAESVGKLSRETLLAHHNRYLHPGRMVLSFVGDVDPDRVIEEVTTRFSGTDEPPVADPVVAGPTPPDAPREVVLHRDREQAHMAIGFLGTTVNSADRFALDVLSTVLSGQGGRLFLELRDRRSLAYSVSAYSIEGIHPGYFVVYIGTSPDKLAEAEEAMTAELVRAASERISADELDRAQRYIAGSHDISLQRRASRAAFIAFNEAYSLGYEGYRDYTERVLAVTADEVRDVAERTLRLDKRVKAVIRSQHGVST
jgi:zinc protease